MQLIIDHSLYIISYHNLTLCTILTKLHKFLSSNLSQFIVTGSMGWGHAVI